MGGHRPRPTPQMTLLQTPRPAVLAARNRLPAPRKEARSHSVAGVDDNGFPPGFFDRQDAGSDDAFYGFPRLVTHIDDGAIDAVGALYEELGVDGAVLDIMSSWVSHFRTAPRHLTVLGMNPAELAANVMATTSVVHDLNSDPRLPFDDDSFDAAVCCVSVDYLVRPIEVFRDVARVVRPGGLFVCTFSNRCFPDQGDPRLAAVDRRAARRDRGRVLPKGRFLRRAGDRAAHAGGSSWRPALRGVESS